MLDLRADYWKSQGRKFCDFCKCWIADNKPSIEFHEGGKKHKENVGKRLKEIHKNSAKQAKQTRKFEDDLKKMESAAMAAYLKDVESNNVDLTAEKIMREKLNTSEKTESPENPNRMPSASPDTVPRFNKNRNYRDNPSDVDYCDPYAQAKRNHQEAKLASQGVLTACSASENKTQSKSNKASRDKRKGKRPQEDQPANRTLLQKLWYEARTSEGYTYYWHIETNESVWEVPAEGFMSIAEQEEEAKEQAIQQQFLEQIDKESSEEKAQLMEERRANAERERLREIRKRRNEARKKDELGEVKKEIKEEIPDETMGDDFDSEYEEKIPYRRDYSVPEKPDPYGPWQTVQVINQKPVVDLQLPKKKAPLVVPLLHNPDSAPSKRIFTEKVVTQLSDGDSDSEKVPTTFKKRKFGMKNVRKRMTDD
ncbi:WW domain-binding protein 4 isoform X2 [Venturia canescens]|uniref:WW domain-binding protein 4 isoform X2 n=1 Tax=Venturia canescens TaxID=32260 RepID=UPI001C9C7DBB|nr:WW domain-binding protein 4 isoform X2 [Venturia canescens]